MSARDHYKPGHAAGADVKKDGEKWTLVLVRELSHPPAKVWAALTDPEQLREWAPYNASGTLGCVGTVTLSTVGAPKTMESETKITRADEPKLLEFNWGDQTLRWELSPIGDKGTRLELWHNITRDFISMGAAGWHICFDVLAHLLDGDPLGRIVGADAMKFEWPRLNVEYANQFGVKAPEWPPKGNK